MILDEPVRGSIPPPWFWALPGIERIRAYSQGLLPLPPLLRLLGIRPAHVGPGSGTWTMPASGSFLTEAGALEIAAFVESALSGVAMTTLAPAMDIEPVTLAVNYFRPTRPQPGSLLARARVVNASRLYTFSEVEIEDPQGRQIAHGAGHAALRTIEPSPPPPPGELRPVEEPTYATPDPYLRFTPAMIPTTEAWQDRDGISIVRGFAQGSLVAPYQALAPVDFGAIEDDRIVLTLPASEWLCRFSRSVCAGAIAALAIRAAGCAQLMVLKRGEAFVGLELTARFYRAMPADGRPFHAEARGRRHHSDLAAGDICVVDADGALVASASGFGAIIDSARRQRRPVPPAKRILTTLLFTDIVGSTGHADRLGDARWRRLLEEYRAVSRAEIAQHDGIEVETIGDGLFARFDSPARALECARAMCAGVRRLGIEVRAGVHTGECELQSGKLAGMAVHIAARVQAAAAPGEVLVSRTVRDLAIGSGLRFEDRGEHTLKGVPGTWRLYALA